MSFINRPGSHVVVEADRTYLDLLIGNLLGNADKYSPRDEAIEVVLSADAGEASVTVLDRGIGFGSHDADTIFAPIYRSAAAKRHAGAWASGWPSASGSPRRRAAGHGRARAREAAPKSGSRSH